MGTLAREDKKIAMPLTTLQELEKLVEIRVLHVDFEVVRYLMKRDERGFVTIDGYKQESIYPDIQTAACNLLGMIGYFC